MLGDWLTYVAVGVLAVEDGGPLAVLGVLLVHTLPRALLAPWAGRIADRYDRRAVLSLGSAELAFGAAIVSVRVWPAKDYTRITLESRDPVVFTHQSVHNPERLVVDLEGVELNDILQSLPTKITGQDPYIQLIRAGRNRPGVVRLVIELKTEVTPQVFTLRPVGEYGHRLVLDLYPVEPVDPLLALLEKISPEEAAAGGAPTPRRPDDKPRKTAAAQPKPQPPQARPEAAPSSEPPRPTPPEDEDNVSRLITIAIDPGHGGNDPGRNMYSPATGLPDRFEPGKVKSGTEEIDLGTTKNVRWVAKLPSPLPSSRLTTDVS